MARAPGGARRRAADRRRAAAAGSGSGKEEVRKGTWTADEDAVLREHVRVHGPRDWSSIRSKGLLNRTGKSCRLRWVNKLRPNLKSGCKFSPEEERIVLDLQAKFGNKWAKISTYLEGRTDNDVKNFWSTRQKRLARLRRSPRPGPSGKNFSAKKAAAPSLASGFARCFFPDQVPFEGSSSRGRASTPAMDAQNDALVTYDQTGFQHLDSGEAFLPALPHSQACSSNAAPLPGSTEIDVNNLWGTSQKQPGRLLRTPLLGQSSRNCSAKTAAASSLQPPPTTGSFLEPVPFEGSSSGGQFHAGSAFTDIDAQNPELVPYDQTRFQLFGIPGTGDSAPEFVSPGAMYDFTYHQELPPFMQSSQMTFPFFGIHSGVKIEPQFDDLPPDIEPQFDELDDYFPPDMFDSAADQLPASPSSTRTISDR